MGKEHSLGRGRGISCGVCAVFLFLFLLVSVIPTFPSTANVSSDYHRQISVRIEPEQMEIIKIDDFDWITLPECSHISTQGHPALPLKSIVVKLPRNAELVKTDIIRMASIGVPGKHMVAPALKPRVISDNTITEIVYDGAKFEALSDDSSFSEPLPEIYDSSVSYPGRLFDFYASKGREHNYVMIYFYPVRFAPLEGGLTLVSEATFDVEYTMEAESPQSLSDPSLDEVIITAPAYEVEADTLAEWRNATQVRTAVFTTDWIYSNYGGVDEPKKIRNFIGDMFNNTGIRYVLLFGDVSDVPTRFAYIPDGNDVGGPDGIEVPTDYYYECLEGTWDPNGDGKYADLAEDNYTEIDFIPEVSVGRLSVDEATASHVVSKIIQYEKNFDPTWFNKMVLTGTDPFTGPGASGAEGEILKDYVQDVVQYNFTTSTKLYETKGTLSASAISENIDAGSGAVNFAGHGHYALWDLGAGGTYTNNDAAGLTNGDKMPIVAAMACLTAGFDSMYNPGNCIGEEFLRNPNGGTAAYVGSTRDAWGYGGTAITSGLAGELDWRFWESFKLGVAQPGPMLTEAKIRYIANHPLDTLHDGYYLDEKTVLEYALLGDPALFLEKPAYVLSPHYVFVKAYKDSEYSEEAKFFTVNDAVYIEANVTDPGGENISDASVYALLYADSSLETSIPLTHLGGNSSLYRGCFYSTPSSTVGVYSVNTIATNPYGSASGRNRFHLYSGWGVSAYRLDWDEDGIDDYVLESEHLISVFDGTEYTDRLVIYLYQKDTGIAYTFGKISNPDSIGRGEITTTGMKGIAFNSFSLQEGENLASASLGMRVNLTKLGPPVLVDKMFTYYDTTNGASPDGNYVVDAKESLAQQFTPDFDTTLVNVSLYVIDLSGGLDSPLIVQIRNDDGTGLPSNDATDLLAEETIAALPTKNIDTWINVTFTAQPALAANTHYWIVLICDEARGGLPWLPQYYGWTWKVDDTAPTYPGYFAGNAGDLKAWTQFPTQYDSFFRAYGSLYAPSILTSSLNLTVRMRAGSVDYLIYTIHNFDENISDFSDVFSDVSGTLGSSVGDDRYHLEDGTDGLISSLTADQWNNYAISNYVCVYDNSTSADPVDDVVMAWVRFNETQTVAYQDVGLWNAADYAAEGLRIRYNVSQALATDGVSHILAFTKGDWKTIDQWMPSIASGQYPDHDIAVTSVTANTTSVKSGETVAINVTVQNEGDYTETFEVTAYYDDNTIETQTVTGLAPGTMKNLTFSWNTAGVAGGTYTIRAEAGVVLGETDTDDNTFIDGKVHVKIPGDVNGDGIVDMSDLALVDEAYGNVEGEPGYNPGADLNFDGVIDIYDLAECGKSYGTVC